MVERAIGSGVEQYVILGAGLDSFGYRRSDLMDRLRVFEVDHPASQSWKQYRLRDLGIEIPDNLVFAPVDFERQTLREGLVSAGFNFARTAVFSWIGVTMYLTLNAIEATLGTISECMPGSQVALTYNQPHRVLDDIALQVTSTFEAIATELGEPFVSLFVPDEIEGLLRNYGFDEIVHFGPQEARAAWFSGAVDVAIAGAQRLIAATVSPLPYEFNLVSRRPPSPAETLSVRAGLAATAVPAVGSMFRSSASLRRDGTSRIAASAPRPKSAAETENATL